MCSKSLRRLGIEWRSECAHPPMRCVCPRSSALRRYYILNLLNTCESATAPQQLGGHIILDKGQAHAQPEFGFGIALKGQRRAAAGTIRSVQHMHTISIQRRLRVEPLWHPRRRFSERNSHA